MTVTGPRLVAGATLAVIALVGAYQAGRQTGRQEAAAVATAALPSIEDLQQQPPDPSVLDLEDVLNLRAAAGSSAEPPTPSDAPAAARSSQPAAEPSAPEPTPRASPAAASTPRPPAQQAGAPVAQAPAQPSAARRPGLNYIVVESFAPDAYDDARRAQAFLAGHGIETTIERHARGYWLITLDGFAGRDPAMRALQARIESLGEQYLAAGGRYRFKGCYPRLLTEQGW